jgi:hypothetical protein
VTHRAAWFDSDPGAEAALDSAAAGDRVQPGVTTVSVVAGVLAAAVLVAADCTVREGFRYISAEDHLVGAFALYSMVGGLLGLLVSALGHLEWLLVGRWAIRRGRLFRLLRPLFYGVVAGVAASDTAVWTFSGQKAQASPLAVWGPIAFCIAIGLGAFVGTALLLFGAAAARRRRPLLWGPVATLFALAGAGFAWVDLTMYVMLYQRIHTILELTAALSFGAAFALVMVAGARRAPRAILPLKSAAIAGMFWISAVVIFPGMRLWLDEKLRHVWLEEAYVGRMLWRFQVVEAFLQDPTEWRGLAVSRIERLRKRYDLDDVSLHPKYNEPLKEPPEFWGKLQTLRGGQQRYDIVVYYVDTLRQDVASDPKTMPNLVAFSETALDFARAYSTGSDTLRSLPGLTGGNYDVGATPPNDLLRVARRADYESVLVIAQSAGEFLGKLRPEFRFERTESIRDYPEDQQVWGYGAQRPTASEVVDRGLAELRKPRTRPLFLWMFNFDQHNWRELDAEYVEQTMKRHDISDEPGKLAYRYRAVAAGLDEQFGRFISALEHEKRLDHTIVLFVSDHGEALGRDGFWVHSVFLWEPLIRVPLRLRVPKVPPRRIEEKVSLTDVAPTLARFMDPSASMAGYHGEDLLGYVLPDRPPRRHPIFIEAASKDVLVRVGLIDPVEEYKLVLSLEASFPELYDLRSPEVDSVTVTREQPERTLKALRELVRSPVFPRTAEDFDVRDTKEQKALAAGKPMPLFTEE